MSIDSDPGLIPPLAGTAGIHPPTTGPALGAVDKALAIHAALREGDIPMRLSEISRRTRMAKATAYRLLVSLISAGMVVKIDQHYLVPYSMRGGDLPVDERNRKRLRALAPYLGDVLVRTGLTASLALLHGVDVLFPYHVFSHRDACTPADDLCRQPAVDTAAGRLLLAFDRRWRARDLANWIGEEQAAELQADLMRIRRTRFAVRTTPEGTTSVAVRFALHADEHPVALAAKGCASTVAPAQVAAQLHQIAQAAATRLQWA
jgi:DNA-binding IclR family transcriptional regulator